MAKCRYCNKEIIWMKEGRKNVPVEGDGAIHECSEFKKSVNSYKVIDPKTLDPEEIKRYQEMINNPSKKK